MTIIPGLFAHYLSRTAGKYYGVMGGNNVITATSAVTASRLYTIPFLVLTAETFDRIGIYVQTGAAGSARLGIYRDVGSAPGSLLLDAGEIDATDAGAKEIVINQTLQPGLYWLAINFNSTPKVMGPTSVSNLTGMGIDSIGLINAGSSVYYTTSAYGALPNPHPAPTVGTVCPGILLRRA
jgi:hypothetical protein